MKRIRQWIALGLAALMSLAVLSACTGKPEEPETPAQPVQELVAEASAEQPKETVPEQPSVQPQEQPETPVVAADPLDFKDNEALRGFLLGTWEYRLPGSAADSVPVLTLTLRDDASYRIETVTEKSSDYWYEGVWAQTAVNAKDDAPLDGFHLSPKPGSDALCGGDFRLTGWSSCDGAYLILLSTLTGDPTVFSLNWNEYDATLRKQTDEPAPAAVGETKKDAHFRAICWKVSEDQRTMWLDDVQDEDIGKNAGRHEAIPYLVREDYEPRCGVDAFLRGGSVAEVYTNADGEITILNWAVKSQND